MAKAIQCDNCGAVLLEEDLFCGECGAPRPSLISPSEPAEAEIPADISQIPESAPELYRPPVRSRSPEKGWRIAFVVLLLVGACLCLAGVTSFLLFGLTESEVASPEENWLYATFCCLLPIAGAGAILALAGAGIWFARLRNR